MSRAPTKLLQIIDHPDKKDEKFEQFTVEGIGELARYYSEKYPDRDPISSITAVAVRSMPGESEDTAEELAKKVVRIVEEDSQSAASQIRKTQNAQKIMLTFCMRKTPEDQEIDMESIHVLPLLLTSDKLILLRNEKEKFCLKVLAALAKKLEVALVKQHENQTERKTSIQRDYTSCMGIAAGILKDLTADDLRQVSQFEDGYKPLPKMLKYSQSLSHVEAVVGDAKSAPVKSGGITLEEYIRDGKASEHGSRIATKLAEFKESWAQKFSRSDESDGKTGGRE